MYEQVVDYFRRAKPSLTGATSRHLGHVLVSQQLTLLDATAGWPGLKSVVCVEFSRWQNNKEEHDKRYYISSLHTCSAAQMGQYIPRHWSIDNEQHWHLDVTFNEDQCQVRKDHAPRNLTTIRKLALALLSREFTKMSLKRKHKKAARDDNYLFELLTQLDL